MNIVIQPRTLSGRVVIPPSKSISHRALICAALAKGESEITGVLQCEDIDATTEALTALGAEIRTENGVTYVKGIEKAPEYAEINCRESGSTLRFIIPVAAALGVGGKAARPSSRIGTVGGKAGAGRKAGEAPRRNEDARGWAGFCGKVLCHVSTHG